ncbi:MAG: hypothetical protein ACC661_09260, partial [Verrucomicrobiales bacterium]
GLGNVVKVVAAIATGETIKNLRGTSEDVFFGLPELSPREQAAVIPFLRLEEETAALRYLPNPAIRPREHDPDDAEIDSSKADILEDAIARTDSAIEYSLTQLDLLVPQREARADGFASPMTGVATVRYKTVRFAQGTMGLDLPSDFLHKEENLKTLLLVPRNPGPNGAAWLRITLEQNFKVEDGQQGASPGVERVRELAFAKGRPLETIGDKTLYWRNGEQHQGGAYYRVTERYVGFGNSVVRVTNGTLNNQRDAPESLRVAEALPEIIESLVEIQAK